MSDSEEDFIDYPDSCDEFEDPNGPRSDDIPIQCPPICIVQGYPSEDCVGTCMRIVCICEEYRDVCPVHVS